jgi:hypothetical protein
MFVYALQDINTFNILSTSVESHGLISNPDIVEIKINDEQYINAYNTFDTGKLQLSRFFHLTHYPVFMNIDDVLTYRGMMRKVPKNGVVVEIGSAYGGSATIAAEVLADKNITYYCIDIGWKKLGHSILQWLKDNDPKFLEYLQLNHDIERFNSTYEFAKDYLSKWPNIKLIPANSPYDITDWDIEIDYLFEDSAHNNPQLSDNLNFWLPFIKKGGIISGHDINDARFPIVQAEAEKLAVKLNQTLNINSHIWWIVKS